MFKIKTMNSISPVGLEALEKLGCSVGADIEAPDGMLIRSADLHEYKFDESLLGIARAGAASAAGAGTKINNIKRRREKICHLSYSAHCPLTTAL